MDLDILWYIIVTKLYISLLFLHYSHEKTLAKMPPPTNLCQTSPYLENFPPFSHHRLSQWFSSVLPIQTTRFCLCSTEFFYCHLIVRFFWSFYHSGSLTLIFSYSYRWENLFIYACPKKFRATYLSYCILYSL